MLEKLQKAQERFCELEKLLADPEVISDSQQYKKLAKEYADITPQVQKFREYNELRKQEEDLKTLLVEKHDAEFEELAQSELEDLKNKQENLLKHLNDIVNPKKSEADKDLIIEIRAGTGGQEASLFAADNRKSVV